MPGLLQSLAAAATLVLRRSHSLRESTTTFCGRTESSSLIGAADAVPGLLHARRFAVAAATSIFSRSDSPCDFTVTLRRYSEIFSQIGALDAAGASGHVTRRCPTSLAPPTFCSHGGGDDVGELKFAVAVDDGTAYAFTKFQPNRSRRRRRLT